MGAYRIHVQEARRRARRRVERLHEMADQNSERSPTGGTDRPTRRTPHPMNERILPKASHQRDGFRPKHPKSVPPEGHIYISTIPPSNDAAPHQAREAAKRPSQGRVAAQRAGEQESTPSYGAAANSNPQSSRSRPRPFLSSKRSIFTTCNIFGRFFDDAFSRSAVRP